MTNYAKLKPWAKRQWLKDLRSGRFVQGRELLCSNAGEFCCLGVLVDGCLEGHWVQNADGWTFNYEVAELEFRDRALVGLDRDAEDYLIILNDRHGATFEEIADWIEENL